MKAVLTFADASYLGEVDAKDISVDDHGMVPRQLAIDIRDHPEAVELIGRSCVMLTSLRTPVRVIATDRRGDDVRLNVTQEPASELDVYCELDEHDRRAASIFAIVFAVAFGAILGFVTALMFTGGRI